MLANSMLEAIKEMLAEDEAWRQYCRTTAGEGLVVYSPRWNHETLDTLREVLKRSQQKEEGHACGGKEVREMPAAQQIKAEDQGSGILPAQELDHV